MKRFKLNQLGFSHVEIFLAIIFVAVVAFVGDRVLNASHALTSGTTTVSCTVSANLVNSCRPWFGAAVSGNPATSNDQQAQFSWLENKIGQKMDFYRQYNSCSPSAGGGKIDCSGGGVPMTPGSDEYVLGTRANTYVDINWKPYTDWSHVSGNDALVNSEIKQAADNIKAVAPHKVMLTIWHEPQNDVTTGVDGCNVSSDRNGTAGNPAQYQAMWNHVQQVFNQEGVSNVVWAVDWMSENDTDFTCQVSKLWPSNAKVDWSLYDVYGTSDHPTWADSTGRLYGEMQDLNTAKPGLGVNSVPWGVGEYGTCGNSSASDSYTYYDGAKSAYDAGLYPKLKLFMVWDDNVDGSIGCLTNYESNGSPDPTKQDKFDSFASDVLNTKPVPKPPTNHITSGLGSGWCLDNSSNALVNYNKVEIYGCHDGPAQVWSLTNSGTITDGNGYCLDVYHNLTAVGTTVDLYQCNGTTAQQWKVDTASHTIVSPRSGLCLNVVNTPPVSLDPVNLNTCNSKNSEVWYTP